MDKFVPLYRSRGGDEYGVYPGWEFDGESYWYRAKRTGGVVRCGIYNHKLGTTLSRLEREAKRRGWETITATCDVCGDVISSTGRFIGLCERCDRLRVWLINSYLSDYPSEAPPEEGFVQHILRLHSRGVISLEGGNESSD